MNTVSAALSIENAGVVNCWVDPILGANRGRAAASLQQLLELGGWRSRTVQNPQDASVFYSQAFASSPNALPCAGPDAWNAVDRQEPVLYEGLRVPSASLTCVSSGAPVLDPVLAGFFFLSGRVEHDSHKREFEGIPEGDSVAEWRLHEIPPVQRLVRMIAAKLPELPQPRPLWPQGKRWAMCLSHDCDRLLRFRTHGFRRDVIRRGASSAERVIAAAKSLYLVFRPKGTDPYEASVVAWLQFERSMNVRGVYFIGTWSRYDTPSRSHDLVHSRSDPETIRLVQACREQGAEIGLHSSIDAWRNDSQYVEEVRRFQESYGIAPEGFRGHYWSLNPNNPEQSLERAAREGGLKYDSSFGMNVAVGFRRGTCYPFRPFDALTGNYSGLWELPPSVMDGGLHASAPTNAARVRAFVGLAETVKESQGALVIDWHSDSLWEGFMDNMTSELLPVLSEIIGDSSCWVASGSEIIEWCSNGRWAKWRSK